MYYTYCQTQVGDFLVAGTATEIHFTAFATGSQTREPQPGWIRDEQPIRYAVEPLCAYFAGEIINFEVPLRLEGTAFQCQVWEALQQVTYGQTASYGDIAKSVGNPGASRAVGAANNANPLPVLVPCHRIIGANGSLTGFGGGLDTKATLLRMESKEDQLELF